MRILTLLPVMVLASGCNLFTKSACKTVYDEVCDRCDLSDYEKDVTCGCLEDGEVSNADDYFEDDDAAERWCFNFQNDLKPTYLTNEDASECRLVANMFSEFGDDTCDYLGLNEPDDEPVDTGGDDTGSAK